jgi:tetratricopeptide (TPR) repeat protein
MKMPRPTTSERPTGTSGGSRKRLPDSSRRSELGAPRHRVWGGLGDARRHLGDAAGARDAYRTALELARQQLAVSPDAAEVNASIARYAVWLGETDLARREIRAAEAARFSRTRTTSSSVTSIVHEQLGLRDEAIRSVREAAALGKEPCNWR